MNQEPCSFRKLFRQPAALLPVVLSLIALGVVVTHIAVYGAAREADEGAAAHIWQLLMAIQLPLLLYFAARWLPRAPRAASGVMALQLAAILSAMAPVFCYHL